MYLIYRVVGIELFVILLLIFPYIISKLFVLESSPHYFFVQAKDKKVGISHVNNNTRTNSDTNTV